MKILRTLSPIGTIAVAATASMVIVALSLAGCGSSGSDSSTSSSPSRSASLNVYVTDSFSDQYSQVLVTLYGIEVSTDSGKTWTSVYSDTAGATIDLTSLSQVSQLLSTVTVPAQSITSVRVTLADSVTLTPKGGDASQAVTLDTTAPNVTVANGQATVTFSAPTAVSEGHLSNLVVDFKLAAFTLVHGLLRPLIGPCDPDVFHSSTKIGYVPGTVTDLVAGTSFTLNLPRPSNGIQESVAVDLTSSTVISSTDGSTATLADGQSVVVQGTVDPTTGALTAQTINIVVPLSASPSPMPSPGSSPAPSPSPFEPEVSAIGIVQSVDTSGDGKFVIRIRRGERFPHPMGGVTVVTNSATAFLNGKASASFANLAVGNEVAVVGQFDPTTDDVTAQNVIILPTGQ